MMRRSGRSLRAKPAIMPAWVEPVTVHTMIVSKKTSQLRLLGRDLADPVGEAEPAQRMVGCAGGDRVRLAAVGLDRVERPLPAVADADVEAGRIDADVAAHDPRQLDVADHLVGQVVPSRPSAPGRSPPRARGGAATPVTGGCGWTGCRRSRRACRSPGSSASAARYSSLRTLLPPKAMPLLQSSRLAQISTLPPSAALKRGKRVQGRRAEEQRYAAEVIEAHGRRS